MMAKRKERKLRLAEERALENIKRKGEKMQPIPINTTMGEGAHGADMDDVAIAKNTLKHAKENRVYPATDTDDKNVSQRIGPLSEDE